MRHELEKRLEKQGKPLEKVHFRGEVYQENLQIVLKKILPKAKFILWREIPQEVLRSKEGIA